MQLFVAMLTIIRRAGLYFSKKLLGGNNMEKWILLSEFLSDKARYDKLTQLFIDYKPDYNKMDFSIEKTGTANEIATTETELSWYADKGSGKTCYLISAQSTTFKLGLYGDRGFRNGIDVIKEYAELLYSCVDMKAKGIGITESFFEKLPKHIKSLNDRYWIPESSFDSDDEMYYEIKTIWEGIIRPDMLFCSSGNRYKGCHSLRPFVRLSGSTLINIGDRYFNGTTPERALKIKI